jgi:hypothetical protein
MNIQEIMSSPVVVTRETTKLKHTRELISFIDQFNLWAWWGV